jgi:hypothetical protein
MLMPNSAPHPRSRSPAELSRDSGERAPNRDRFDGYEAL